MVELIKPVLLTYATRRSMQIIVGLGGLIYALVIFAMAMDPRTAPEHRAASALIVLGVPAGMVAHLLASQAKWQFVDPRARLLPRFARPHLVVLLGLAVVGLFIMPLLAAIAARLSVVGFLACAIGLASSFIWVMHANGGLASLPMLIVFFSLMSEWGRRFWLLPASVEQFFPLHLAVLAAGWVAVAMWLRRLARMTEESEDYDIPMAAQSGSSTRMERTQASRNMLRNKLANGLWDGGPSDWWHDRLTNYRARTANDRQGLLRYGFAPLPFEFSVAWMAMIMGAVALLLRWQDFSNDTTRGLSAGALIPFVFLPSVVPGQFLAMRRARMAQELMLPMTRERLVDGLLLEAARVTIISLAVLMAAALALITLFPFDYPSTPKILAALAVLAAVQPYFFGAIVYAALRTSAVARIGIMALAVAPGTWVCAGAIALLKYSGPAWAFALAAMILPFGLWIVAKARQKWLDAELAT